MKFGNIWLVFQKDWQEIRQSKQILIPIIVLPLVIVVVLPTLAVQAPSALGGIPTNSSSLTGLSTLGGMNDKQSFVYMMATVVFAPFTPGKRERDY